jgi:hypothetical protein
MPVHATGDARRLADFDARLALSRARLQGAAWEGGDKDE